MTEVGTFIEIIEKIGFPIVITFFLLMRVEKKIEALSLSINNLSQALSKQEN